MEVDASEAELRPESLRVIDQRIIDALVRARAHLGLESRVEMARLMQKETQSKWPDISTYNRWEEGTRRIPADALWVVAEVTKYAPEGRLTTAQLLDEPEGASKPQSEYLARIARTEKHIARIEKRVARLIPLVEQALERKEAERNPERPAANDG